MKKILSILTFWAPKAPLLAHNKGGRLLTSFYKLFNLGAFLLLCGGVLPTSLAQDLTIDTPTNIRTPHNTGDGALLTLQANNIQVRAEWSVTPDNLFHVDDDGKLRFIGNIDTATNIAVTVMVKDKFKDLNEAYTDLTAHAVINMALTPGVQRTLFVLGGSQGGTQRLRDVWKSSDGQNWDMASTLWADITGHQAIVHNGTIYVLGGFTGSLKNDVWYSVDGKTWDTHGTADWSARINHQAVVHHGTIYVLGGSDGSVRNDVWASTDGRSWSPITLSANWPARDKHQVVSYQEKLYLLGGSTVTFQRLDDVWSSPDGAKWTLETSAGAKWPARHSHQAIVHHNKIYVLGGQGATEYSDVWSSNNGTTWSRDKESNNSSWNRRYEHQVVSYNGQLYILGGYGTVNSVLTRYNDIWSSVDGNEWALETGTNGADWPTRRAFQAIVFP